MLINHDESLLSPKDRVVGPFPNRLSMANTWGGDPMTTYPSPGMILQVEAKQRPLKPNRPVAIVDEIYPIASMGLVYLPYIYYNHQPFM